MEVDYKLIKKLTNNEMTTQLQRPHKYSHCLTRSLTQHFILKNKKKIKIIRERKRHKHSLSH